MFLFTPYLPWAVWFDAVVKSSQFTHVTNSIVTVATPPYLCPSQRDFLIRGIRLFLAYSLVVVLNVDVIMVYFFLKYSRLLLINENKRKNCPALMT